MRRFVAVLAVAAAAAVVLAAGPAGASRYAAIVVNADTNEVLFARNADSRRYPASLTKMMTLYLAFDALEAGKITLETPMKVSRRAAGQTPSRLGLKAGSRLTVEDAILAMVTKSANDAATVLAEQLGGTEIEFAKTMTEKARELGMEHTTFRNASGLPDRHQVSTARDMAILANALLDDHAAYYDYFSTEKFTYRGRTYRNHNHLLDDYEGTDGIKTGYIRASGFNVAASVERGDRRLIAVVFGGRTARSRDEHAEDLLDRAFAVLQARNVPTPLHKPPPPVEELQLAADAPAEASAPEQGSADDPPRIEVAYAPDEEAVGGAALLPGADWLIQVGAFSTRDAAFRQVGRAADEAARYLDNARVAVREGPTVDGRPLFRARILGLSETDAEAACAMLVRKDIGCVAMRQPADG